MNSHIFQQFACKACKGLVNRLALQASGRPLNLTCSISTSQALQRKRQDRRFRPKVRPFSQHGATHRLVRGLDASSERYGPLIDGPDYTYLDGRPTPLTPSQMEERQNRKAMTAKVVQQLTEMEVVKGYTAIREQQDEQRNREILSRKLKPKS